MRLEYLLADEKHIYRAKIKVVEEGQRRKAIVCWMLAGVELRSRALVMCLLPTRTLGSQERTMTVFPLYCMM